MHKLCMRNFGLLLSLLSYCVMFSLETSDTVANNFLHCISLQKPSIPIPIYSPDNSSFLTIFNSSARNLRFLSSTSPKPQFVITPLHESHVQAAVVCCRKHGLDLKVRSGGHDVEGLSYVSDVPFVMIDLVNYRNIKVDVQDKSAWIQAGAQVGEVYYKIAEKSKTLAFPAGFCPTVGVGGHFSGGGMGSLTRKYGLSSDNILDARIVNVDGMILDKESMGEDLFWALRGGGANNFGVVLWWKVRLVPIKANVIASNKIINLEQNATSVVYKWQHIAHKLHEDLYIGFEISVGNASKKQGDKTLFFSFNILFLGGIDELLQITQESFPELGLQRKDCIEMSWVESHMFFYLTGRPLEALLDRDHERFGKAFIKVKSDYVKEPISKAGLNKIWRKFLEGDYDGLRWLCAPLGGRMNEISEFETPYPHRAGNIYNIAYVGIMADGQNLENDMDWIRKFYRFMTPYVSKFPRAAYLNYKDLDLGDNKDGALKSYSTWGSKYFKNNFNRLVDVKKKVDPDNFFKNKQSIPPYYTTRNTPYSTGHLSLPNNKISLPNDFGNGFCFRNDAVAFASMEENFGQHVVAK